MEKLNMKKWNKNETKSFLHKHNSKLTKVDLITSKADLYSLIEVWGGGTHEFPLKSHLLYLYMYVWSSIFTQLNYT